MEQEQIGVIAYRNKNGAITHTKALYEPKPNKKSLKRLNKMAYKLLLKSVLNHINKIKQRGKLH